jgi:hypothetical protein
MVVLFLDRDVSLPLLATTSSDTLSTTLFKTSIVFYRASVKNGKNDAKSESKFRRFINKCDIIVVRGKEDNLSNSTPCMRCTQMLKNYGLRRVYYSFGGALKMEKVNEMQSMHVSSRYRKPFSEFNTEKNLERLLQKNRKRSNSKENIGTNL